MIKTIIFDIGNVLAGFDWRGHYRSFGYDEAMVERLAQATVKSPAWQEYDRGVLSDEEILDLFIQNDPALEQDIRKVLASFSTLITRYDYAIDWIKKWKAKGYQVLVLSNYSDKGLKESWHSLDFLPYVDGGILSFREKLIKPMPEIYRLLLSRYGLRPEECVFLDDTPENVDAARREGIWGIRFENREQAETELEKLGVC